ncbi:hypothetical protein KY289_036566 [Solanum tuberosum]|nr:hypothetical protein KY289_036566 [Solanum tuberosum]
MTSLICLVGSFPETDDIPTYNDVRRWAQQMWKGVQNLQVYDMNGIQFLFEFQIKKVAERIFMGDRIRQGKWLMFEWWSPKSGVAPEHKEFNWFWI